MNPKTSRTSLSTSIYQQRPSTLECQSMTNDSIRAPRIVLVRFKESMTFEAKQPVR